MKSRESRKANLKTITIGISIANALVFGALTITMATYYASTYHQSYQQNIDSMDKTVKSSSQIVHSIFEPRNDRIKDIRNYVETKNLTITEATAFIKDLAITEDTTLEFISTTGEAVSSFYDATNVVYDSLNYPQLNEIYSSSSLTEADDPAYHCVPQYLDLFSNKSSFGVYTKFKIDNGTGTKVPYTLVCTSPSDTITDTLNHLKLINDISMAIIDNDGNYLLKDEAFPGINVYSELVSHECIDASDISSIKEDIINNGQYKTVYNYENSDQRMLAIYGVEGQSWNLVGKIKMASLYPDNLHLGLAIATSVVLCVLVVVDIAVLAYSANKLNVAMSILKRQNLTAEDALNSAEQASKAKSVFLNNMSHDIRTPMNAIIGFTTLAQTHIDDTERVKDYLEKVQLSSSHLLSLINDVLDMSRIESGKLTLENKPTNINNLMYSLRDVVVANIEQKGLHFFVDTVNVNHEDIICDNLRLNQVLFNLVSNAIKFTLPNGYIFLTVKEKESTNEGKALYEFHIKDTGIGMSPSFMSKLFDPFEREHTSTVSHTQGTGLGMSITKNIVDMMGGTIDVKSQQNVGTEFTINIEFDINQEVARDTHEIAELKDARALVISPFPYACELLSRSFAHIGLHSDFSMSTEEALAKIKEANESNDPYKAFIISSKMRDVTLIDLIKQVRELNQDGIILVGRKDDTEQEALAREAGANGFLATPTLTVDIYNALRANIGTMPVSKPKRITEVDFTGAKLLVVEDNALNREIAIEILTEAGFDVEAVADGDLAVEKIKQMGAKYYKAILMDIQMPTLDGYEATKQIRALSIPGVRSLPILAMTANAFDEDRRNAFAAGMNEHIAKPISIDDLISKLKKFVK